MTNKTVNEELQRKQVAEALKRTRTENGMSQEELAEALGVGRRTIQNWEKGISGPDIVQAIQWFRVLNVNPLPYLFQTVFPTMDQISGKDDITRIRQALKLILEDLPEEGVRQLLYLFYGDHGSSPRAVMHLVTAHLQTPMKDKLSHAKAIAHDYEIAEKKGQLRGKEHVQPDMKFLNDAISEGEEAVLSDRESYTM